MKEGLDERRSWQQIGTEVSDVLNVCIQLEKVICIYKTISGSRYIEVAKPRYGKLGSFIPVNNEYLEQFALQIIKPKDKKEQVRPEIFTIYKFPILYLSRNREIVLFSDDAVPSREILYKGSKKIIRNLPKTYYLIRHGRMLILEKIKDEFYAINLPNVNINGDVCFGTTMSVTPEERIEDIMQRYFDAFWKTSFNSHSDSTGYKWQGKTFTYKARVNLSPIRITL